MAPNPLNIYQLQKAMRPVIAAAQQVFADEIYHKAFSFLACTSIEDAKGRPISLRIDLKIPSQGQRAFGHTIAMTPSLFDEASREDYFRREANKLAKSMRYRHTAALQAKEAGLVGFDKIEDGSMANISADDDVGQEEA